jgi:hypothetical protein
MFIALCKQGYLNVKRGDALQETYEGLRTSAGKICPLKSELFKYRNKVSLNAVHHQNAICSLAHLTGGILAQLAAFLVVFRELPPSIHKRAAHSSRGEKLFEKLRVSQNLVIFWRNRLAAPTREGVSQPATDARWAVALELLLESTGDCLSQLPNQ